MSRKPIFDDDADSIARRKIPEPELDFTSMIDVTFLLLIFFMVGAKIQNLNQKEADMPVAKFGVGVPQANAVQVILRADVNRAVLVLESGEEVDIEGLKRHVSENVLRNRKQVILKAERTVPYRAVQEAARAIAEIPGAEFFVGVKEK